MLIKKNKKRKVNIIAPTKPNLKIKPKLSIINTK